MNDKIRRSLTTKKRREKSSLMCSHLLEYFSQTKLAGASLWGEKLISDIFVLTTKENFCFQCRSVQAAPKRKNETTENRIDLLMIYFDQVCSEKATFKLARSLEEETLQVTADDFLIQTKAEESFTLNLLQIGKSQQQKLKTFPTRLEENLSLKPQSLITLSCSSENSFSIFTQDGRG